MRRKRIKISPFLSKLYEIVSSPENSSVIKWNDEGDAFQITDFPLFCNELLPKYFKHRNFASFVRQLNMYDFHKLKSPASVQEFSNVSFLRGKSNSLKDIKRKVLIDNDEEYYRPYKRIRQFPDREHDDKGAVNVVDPETDLRIKEKIDVVNRNMEKIEEYCQGVLKDSKLRKEEIKLMKLNERNEEKLIFDLIGKYQGVEYESFRKKKLMNKKQLIADIFKDINEKEKFGYDYNEVMKEVYNPKSNQHLNTMSLNQRFREVMEESFLRQKTKREEDPDNNDILTVCLKFNQKSPTSSSHSPSNENTSKPSSPLFQ